MKKSLSIGSLVAVKDKNNNVICEAYVADRIGGFVIAMPKSTLIEFQNNVSMLGCDISRLKEHDPVNLDELHKAGFVDDNKLRYESFDEKKYSFELLENIDLPKGFYNIKYDLKGCAFYDFHGQFEANLPELDHVYITEVGMENLYMVWRGLNVVCKYANLKTAPRLGIFNLKKDSPDDENLSLEAVQSFEPQLLKLIA